MKRFYGSAVFEGVEVANSALIRLRDIRTEERNRVAYHKREFRMQIDELNYWRANEVSAIDNNAYNQINNQISSINRYYREIVQIQLNVYSAIAAVQMRSFLKLQVKLTREENEAIASIRAVASHHIQYKNQQIAQCYREIAWIKSERSRLIAQVHRDYAIEYNIRLTRREKDIAWTHEEAIRKIEAVLALRYSVPVFMTQHAKGACEYCLAKYGTTGTREELDTLSCIPPFHDNCRCSLEQVGYVVMTH